jgi:uncharacterized repeat protein (TIGR01451 family)
VHNHIPLDPTVKAVLFVQKTASPSEAELGDSILYTVTVKNSSTSAIPGVVETDQLPAGFRYIEGTSRLNGARIADPAGGAGPVLTFAIGSLNAGEERRISFRARIGVGAQQGDGVSRAYAASGAVRSNEARAAVRVQGGAFSDKAIVLGKVYVDCNADRLQNIGEPGIPGVRLYIEDGTFTVTDGEGKYSFYGLSARTHVVKVDTTTLPAASKLVPLSTRNAGDADTVFLSAKFNGLHRADFAEGSCTPSILDEVRTRRERVNRTAEPLAAPAREANDNNTSSNSGPSK